MFTKNFYKGMVTGSVDSLSSSQVKISIYATFEDGVERSLSTIYHNGSSATYACSLGNNPGVKTSNPLTISNGTTKFTNSSSQATSELASCVILGDGNTPATINDVKISGNLITDFTATTSCAYDPVTGITATYNITNTGSAELNIKEIALLAPSGQLGHYAMIERTVLQNELVIGGGETKALVYRIGFGESSAESV